MEIHYFRLTTKKEQKLLSVLQKLLLSNAFKNQKCQSFTLLLYELIRKLNEESWLEKLFQVWITIISLLSRVILTDYFSLNLLLNQSNKRHYLIIYASLQQALVNTTI
jgi:hypothetical protein